jgi:uncharacterized protein HemX
MENNNLINEINELKVLIDTLQKQLQTQQTEIDTLQKQLQTQQTEINSVKQIALKAQKDAGNHWHYVGSDCTYNTFLD